MSRVDLSPPEVCLLVKLVFDGPATLNDLGQDLSLPRGAMKDAADQLEVKRLLVRARDGREVLLEATAGARSTLLQPETAHDAPSTPGIVTDLDERSPLSPARGLILSVVIGALLWLGLFASLRAAL